VSSDLETQLAILEENILGQTQEDMDRFYTAFKTMCDLPRDTKILPGLLDLVKKQGHSADITVLKMNIVTYIEEFDARSIIQQIASDAESLVREAQYFSTYLFLSVLNFSDRVEIMKNLYPHLSAENKTAISQIFNDIIRDEDWGFGFSSEEKVDMRRLAHEITGESE
jgi:hypothetical protein